MKREFAAEYAALDQWHWWFSARRRILASLVRRELAARAAAPRSNAAPRVVSLGSGPTESFAWLRDVVPGADFVVGVDGDPSGALRESSGNDGNTNSSNGGGTGAGLVIGTFEHLPLADASCDIIFALDVVEHLADDVGALREASRRLKPNGVLIVTVPALPMLWGRQDVVSHHYRRYTRASLLRAFADAGLPAPRVTYFNTLLFPLVAAIRVGRRVTGSDGEDVSDFEGSRPGLVNSMLRGIFAFERHAIGRVPLPIGVSLVAVHRGSAGPAG